MRAFVCDNCGAVGPDPGFDIPMHEHRGYGAPPPPESKGWTRMHVLIASPSAAPSAPPMPLYRGPPPFLPLMSQVDFCPSCAQKVFEAMGKAKDKIVLTPPKGGVRASPMRRGPFVHTHLRPVPPMGGMPPGEGGDFGVEDSGVVVGDDPYFHPDGTPRGPGDGEGN